MAMMLAYCSRGSYSGCRLRRTLIPNHAVSTFLRRLVRRLMRRLVRRLVRRCGNYQVYEIQSRLDAEERRKLLGEV
jgi:hypothetical protein